jgi:hypothetical protein
MMMYHMLLNGTMKDMASNEAEISIDSRRGSSQKRPRL